jgi:hypothetical protein
VLSQYRKFLSIQHSIPCVTCFRVASCYLRSAAMAKTTSKCSVSVLLVQFSAGFGCLAIVFAIDCTQVKRRGRGYGLYSTILQDRCQSKRATVLRSLLLDCPSICQ